MNVKGILPIAITAASMLCIPAAALASGEGTTPMKVMSYNIRYSTPKDTAENAWSARREPSNAMLRDERPDIVGLQEPRPDQCRDLIEAFGNDYNLFWAVKDGVEPKQCGHTAIMYRKDRFNLLGQGHFWLSPTPYCVSQPEWNATDRQYRTTVWVHLYDKLAGKDLYFFNTHLPYKSADNEARRACVELNVKQMQALAGEDTPVFITGDMNASWAEGDERRVGLEPYYEWMHGARETAPVVLNGTTPSFNGFGHGKPKPRWNLDHILYRNVTPLEFNVVSSPDYGVTYISDHYPITLTLEY